MGIGFDSIKTPPIGALALKTPVARMKTRIKVLQIAHILEKAAREDRFLLSRDTLLASRQDRLETLMEELRRDIAAG